MRKYLICYWTEKNDVSTDVEDIVEAKDIIEALVEFSKSKIIRRVTSVSEIPNSNYIPNFDYEKRT